MKNILIIITCLLSSSVFAKEVHLDCQTQVTKTLGENLYGKSSYSVGEDRLWRFDINLESETGKALDYSSKTYSSNPNDPSYILAIGDKSINFGQMSGRHYFQINREDLSFYGFLSYGWSAFFEGNCELIEKREAPKRAF